MEVTRKIAKINTSLYNTIYKYLEITMPLHKLQLSHVKLLSHILYYYHISELKDEIDIWADVFGYNNRIKIREALGDISGPSFNNGLAQLRKKGVIKNNRVIPEFNPAITKGSEAFEIVIRFIIKDNDKIRRDT